MEPDGERKLEGKILVYPLQCRVCLHQRAQAFIDAKQGQLPSELTLSVNSLQKCFALNVRTAEESHVKEESLPGPKILRH